MLAYIYSEIWGKQRRVSKKLVIIMASQHEFNLKLSCKKIGSGKCQVRFQAKLNSERLYYGYFLTNPEEKLKDVVTQLNNRLSLLKGYHDPFHFHLYSVGKKQKLEDFIIFQSKAS
jgi:hypothetical protein